MVSSKIFGAASPGVKSASGYTSSDKSGKASDEFTKVLDGSIKSSDKKYAKADSIKGDKSGRNKVKPDGKPDKASGKNEQLKKLFGKNDVDKTGELAQDTVDAAAAAEEVAAFNAQVISAISEQLNVPEEEVTQVMEELGFDEFDMLKTKNVVDVISKLTGNDNTAELLLDDSITALIKDINKEAAEISSLLENQGMTRELFKEVKAAKDISELSVAGEQNRAFNALDAVKEETSEALMDAAVEDSVYENNAVNQVNDWNQQQDNSTDSQAGNQNAHQNREQHGVHDAGIVQGTISGAQILENISEYIDESANVGGSRLSERIFSQILDGVRANVGPETTSLELQLNPESLGKVNITVSSKDGVLTAQIAAQNQIAKEAIESQINVLRENFENQGIKVEAVEVTLASRGFEQNFDRENGSEEQNRSRRGRRISAGELEEINGLNSDTDEELVEEVHKEQGNTVSYTA